MGMREKLIELVNEGAQQCSKVACVNCEHFTELAKCKANMVADHLIANGVTIPVRCKECKYRRGDFFGGFVCRLHKGLAMVTDESFCSRGERRTDETKTD